MVCGKGLVGVQSQRVMKVEEREETDAPRTRRRREDGSTHTKYGYRSNETTIIGQDWTGLDRTGRTNATLIDRH